MAGEITMELDNYVKQVQAIRQNFLKLTPVVEKCDQILATINAYQQQRLSQVELTALELSTDLIFDNLIEYPQLMDVSPRFENLRQVMIESFGIWHICNQLWINDLQAFCGLDSHNLEIMAGNAVISANLKNTIATDNLDWQGQDNDRPCPWTAVEKLDAVTAVQKYYSHVDNIIMAWAPDSGEVDWQVLQFLRQNHFQGNLIVIGERNGATNSAKFWQNAQLQLVDQLNQHHRPFDFINDQVWLVK